MGNLRTNNTIETITIETLITNRKQPISDPPEVKLLTLDFDSGQNSAIIVRERVRGSKIDCAYKTCKAKLWANPNIQ